MKDPYGYFINIKKARQAAGLSQKELAKALGVSDKTISAYETGRAMPPSSTLAQIAKITDMSISKIIGVGENEEEIENDKLKERLIDLEQRVSNLEQTLIKFLK